MNTPLEVMKAIVENGGPKEMWVSQDGKDWVQAKVAGFDLESIDEPILVVTKHGLGRWYKFASLTDPNKNGVVPMKWISVKDQLPPINTLVLTFDGEFIGIEERLHTGRDDDWSQSYSVTHWMPLPEPPKEVEG